MPGDNPVVTSTLKRPVRTLAALAAVVILWGSSLAAAAPTIGWRLLDTRPHDRTAFTEGLVKHGAVLLESTGSCCPGEQVASTVRRVDPRTGRVLDARELPRPLFAEGLTVLRGTAWQLTWLDRVAFSLSPDSLVPQTRVPYAFEGWGLTTQGSRLLASDGSARLRWLRVPDLRMTRSVDVRDGAQPVTWLNELELLDGVLWANVWKSDRIALIDPASGVVRAWLDMSPLRRRVGPGAEVLNGIARDPVTGHVVVTGKLWDRMFVIRLTEPIPRATR